MTTRHSLYDNSTVAFVDGGGPGNTLVSGVPFASTAGGFISGLRFFRPNTTLPKPTTLSLWDHATGALLARVVNADINDSGAVGWQDTPLATPIELVTGREYRATTYTPAGQSTWVSPIATRVAAPTPLLFSDYSYYWLFSSDSQPTNADNTYFPQIDIIWTDDGSAIEGSGGVVVGGGGFGTTSGSLADWLDTTVGTQAYIAPLKTQALATGASGFDAIKAVADAVAAAVSGLPGTIAGAVTTITGQLTSLVGTVVDTSTVTIGRIIHDLAAVTINTQNSLVELARLSEGSGTFPSDVGTLVWTMLDETDFAGEIAWAQPADVYVLSITTRPHGFPLNFTDGVHTIYRCGWWTPLNGSFARQRSYIDFEDNHLTIGVERMPGVLVSLQPGGEGHIQAWALT